jgi:flagellar protein FliJ
MKKSMRLEVLANLAEMKEKEAIKSIVDGQNLKNAEEQKLQQLVAFRDQYLDNSRETGQNGTSIARLIETRIFVDKIAQAIEEQERRICAAENLIQNRNIEWIRSRRNRLGFEGLIRDEDRHQARIRDKKGQTEIDDRSARKIDPYSGT